MEFDPTQPIWLQLVAEFSRRIVVGTWQPGERVPGVRDLAVELGVNPNTVQRSLAELERDGLMRTERTTGRFVTDDPDRLQGLRRQLASQAADDYITRARGFAMDLAAAQALIDERWTRHDGNPRSTAEGE